MNSGNKTEGQTARDEHLESALAKRVVGIGFDYENENYTVIGVDQFGRAIVQDKENVAIEQRLETVETLLRLFLLHMEKITGEEFGEVDLDIGSI